MKYSVFVSSFRICLLLTLLFIVENKIWAQVEKDSTKVDILGTIQLQDIEQMLSTYEYDPHTDTYIYTKKVGDFDVEYPVVLTRKQYEDLLTRREMLSYFRQKIAAADGRLSEEEQKDLLPKYYVNSGLFKSIFGSNTIDVKPMGSVETDLGVRYSRQDNPLISPRNRSVVALDFNPRISMSLQGKVGTNMDVNINYNTQATFGFQQQLAKLNFQPGEDDILQALEVGNVSMPVNNSLIRGAQSLFGVKSTLQFGATTITGVFSRQNSERRTITAQGGGTVQDFEMFALDYEKDKHYFLSQYFRNRYDDALKNYPFIDSRVRILRLEVWITNRQNRLGTSNNNFRNVIALQDLGESRLSNVEDSRVIGLDLNTHSDFLLVPANTPTNNANNQFDPGNIGSNYLNQGIRQINTAASGFDIPVIEGRDYVKLENARKLTESEYKFHPQLGYISLQQELANDEVLAVAYEYTIGDKVYRVGEFGTDGIESTVVGQNQNGEDIPTTQSLVLKMLKSALTSTDEPVWDLMMKNIYSLEGVSQIEQDGFRFNILYTDPQPLNYIQPVAGTTLPTDVANTALLNVFHLDRLNSTNDPQNGGDGYFDFISQTNATNPLASTSTNNGYNNNQSQVNNNKFEGITVDTYNGRIIFTTVEPFGSHLFKKLSQNASENYDVEASYNENQKKYVFRNLYRLNKARALQESSKNKFQLKGRFKSAAGDGIPIGASNVAQGSVVVTSNGRILIEGQDYSVDYQMGRVKILDPSLANAPIEISVESNTMFQQQQRTFFGVDLTHKFSDKFSVGATYLRLSEQPITVKSIYGDESVNNTIYGFNTNYNSEAPFLTRWANKLPFVDTDAPSTLSFRGEFAYLKPGASKRDRMNGEATSYIDNFEGTQTNIDISSPNLWKLSSVPVGYGEQNTDLSSGYRRAKMSWYKIDPVFYSSNRRPDELSENDLSSNRTRRIFKEELFPSMDIANGELLALNTLDLTYYPKERGPYNFNPQFLVNDELPNPASNWAGIMRSLTSTNFEQTNVEYVEFWLMDPYTGNAGDHIDASNTGELHFNFGYISEDILQDGLKQFENGLPGVNSNAATISSIWGKVPASTALIYAFDTDTNNRRMQDVGLDGLTDEDEAQKHPAFAELQDPAADNYEYFLSASGNILQRYKNFNGTQGNTPVEFSDSNRGAQVLPDVEDIDGDNTMNTINAYYDFKVDIQPNPVVGTNYVVDVRTTEVTLQNGNTTPVKWVQYKVPIDALSQNAVGAISDLQSVRFMRMFVTGFTDEVTLRFGTLDLVQSNWRTYDQTLIEDPNATPILGNNTGFEVRTLNIIDNYTRQPIPYVMPPEIVRERVMRNNSVINQNEQSLALRVFKQNTDSSSSTGLEPGDSRAIFKNVSVDMRRYNKLRMFIHGEALEPATDTQRLKDDEMVAFLRFGNDFTNNYYQVEIPVKLTEWGATTAEQIWRIENEIELHLRLLTELKLKRNADTSHDPNYTYFKQEDELDPSFANKSNKLRIGIKGNPNFGMIRTIMIGVRNNTDVLYANTANAPRDIQGEVWFNELRISDLDNKAGWAATAALDTRIADLASVSVSANKSTIGFGALEQGPQERSMEDVFQYNVTAAVAAEKLLPKKWNLNLPVSYSISEQIITPEFDPNNPDVRLKTAMDNASNADERKQIKDRAIDYTKNTSINFIGVRKNKGENQKDHFYNIENFTLSHSYNKIEQHNFEVEQHVNQTARTSIDYNYGFKYSGFEPFKKATKFKEKKYFKWLSDFNFNPLPNNVSFNTNILRQFNQQKYRSLEVQGLEISPLYRRNYFFNYNYGLNFQLTKKLNATYSVSNSNIVRNFIDAQQSVDNSKGIWDGYFDPGMANMHTQQFTLNYELPFDKFPFLNFIKSTYAYTSDFSWQRTSDAMANIEYNGVNYQLGNTIQNANTHNLNTNLSMDRLYKYLGLVPSSQKAKTVKKKETVFKPGEKVERNVETRSKQQKEEQKENAFSDALINFVTMVKKANIVYQENNGTVLPGYLPGLGFFGTSNPSLGFVFGSQADIRSEAARNGWLTTYPEYNQMFSRVKSNRLTFNAELRPLEDFVIEVSGDRRYSYNVSEQYDISNGVYNARAPYEFGNFSISTIMLGTSFMNSNVNSSKAFDTFRDNRLAVANQLATQRGIDLNNPANRDQYGFPLGYSRSSQEVLIPAFLSAYTGTDPLNQKGFMRNIPLPNWKINYRGLVKIQWFKENFRRFTLQHGYNAFYAVNQFQTNNEYLNNPEGLNSAGNYHAPIVVGNINMVENFNPLIGVDFETKEQLSFKANISKQRMLSLSFDNNLLTEMSGNSYNFDLGFRIKDIAFNTDFEGVGDGGRIVSDLIVRAGFTWEKNHTLIRYLDYSNTQIGGGLDRWEVRLTGEYNFSKNFTGIFYYTHNFSKAVISTMFPITNIRTGFTLRYNFGN